LKLSPRENWIVGAVICEPSKQGSLSSPKIQSFEIIASLTIKNYGFPLLCLVQKALRVFSSSSID
jgi:hypothetical protein